MYNFPNKPKGDWQTQMHTEVVSIDVVYPQSECAALIERALHNHPNESTFSILV